MYISYQIPFGDASEEVFGFSLLARSVANILVVGVFDGFVLSAENGEDVGLLIIRREEGSEEESSGMPEDVGDSQGAEAGRRIDALLLYQLRRELNETSTLFDAHDDLRELRFLA